MTLTEALQYAAIQGVERSIAQAWLLQVIGQKTAYLRTWPERLLNEQQCAAYQAGLVRLSAGEPLAYVMGEQAFWRLNLAVTPDTLIPRPDTECLVEQALALDLPCNARVLDLGTGSGAIALALAQEREAWRITAVDQSARALDVARHNAQKHQIDHVQFAQGSWFEPLAGNYFELIVSNPPYIDPTDEHLQALTHEPISALIADEQGLADLRHIITHAPSYLSAGGWLLVEHGYDQAIAVQQLFVRTGFTLVHTQQDYGGNDRVTMGQFLHTL